MNKWYVYNYNDERIATLTGSLRVTDGGAVTFSDHLGVFAVYPDHAYGFIARADWEEAH